MKELIKYKFRLVLFQMALLGVVSVSSIFIYVYATQRVEHKDWEKKLNRATQFLSQQIQDEVKDDTQKADNPKSHALSSLKGEMTEEEYLSLLKKNRKLSRNSDAPLSINYQEIHDSIGKRVLGLSEYQMFIVSKSGEMLLDRDFKKYENQGIWNQYQKKLIYEMTKQKSGWVRYPHVTESGQNQGQFIIRYLTVPQTGWILGVEGYYHSQMDFLQQVLNPQILFGLAVVLGVCCLGFVFMVNRAFGFSLKIITKSLEDKYVHINQKLITRKKDPFADYKKRRTPHKPELGPIADNEGDLLSTPAIKEDFNYKESFQEEDEDSFKFEDEQKKSLEDFQEKEIFINSSQLREASLIDEYSFLDEENGNSVNVKVKKKTEPKVDESKQYVEQEGEKIENKIKSPLLKKMLRELKGS